MLTVTVPSNFTGKVFSRALWIDVEPQGELFAIVVRGEDKVKAGAKESAAADAADAKEHKPALFWNDASAAPIGYAVATFADKSDAELCASQLLGWYDDETESPEYEAITGAAVPVLPVLIALGTTENYTGSLLDVFRAADYWQDRVDALSTDARAVLPVLMTVFGPSAIGAMRQPGKLGSYADFAAGTWRKRQPKKVDDAAILRQAAAIIKAMQSKAPNDDIAGALGVDAETYANILAITGAVAAV